MKTEGEKREARERRDGKREKERKGVSRQERQIEKRDVKSATAKGCEREKDEEIKKENGVVKNKGTRRSK